MKMAYNGVFVRGTDLRDWFEEQFGIPTHGRTLCHHMTSHFKPKGEEQDLPYGKRVPFTVIGYIKTDDVAAIAVKCDIPSANEVPHITVWVNDGVAPKSANTALEAGYRELSGPTFFGQVGYVVYESGKQVVKIS